MDFRFKPFAVLSFVLVSPAASLRAGSLEDEIDAWYREPRTAERVLRSLAFCEGVLATRRDAAVLSRAARACAWLGKNAGKKGGRDYAKRGAALAKEAMSVAPREPDGYYYYSLNLGVLSRLDRTSRWITESRAAGLHPHRHR